jgi:hypothetical protein
VKKMVTACFSCWLLEIHSSNLSQPAVKVIKLPFRIILTLSKAGVLFLAGLRDFSLFHSVQTGSGAHPAFYSLNTEDNFLEDKVAGAWSWPLLSNTELDHKFHED